MATWFTVDTHFGHTRIVDPTFGTPRAQFASIEAHDEALIANWNAVVAPGDTVWHLGDFSYKCHPRRERAIFDRLHGVKHLVRGNHDRDAGLPWASIRDVRQVIVEGTRIWLSHYRTQDMAEAAPGRPAPLRALARDAAGRYQVPGCGRGLLGVPAGVARRDPRTDGGERYGSGRAQNSGGGLGNRSLRQPVDERPCRRL